MLLAIPRTVGAKPLWLSGSMFSSDSSLAPRILTLSKTSDEDQVSPSVNSLLKGIITRCNVLLTCAILPGELPERLHVE